MSLEVSNTHIRACLDFSNSSLIELSSVGLPVLDLVLLLNTSGVTLKAALVNIIDPAKMGLGSSRIDTRLEGDNELSRDDVILLGYRSGSRKDSREQSSKEDGEVANVDHLEDGKDGPIEATENPRLVLG